MSPEAWSPETLLCVARKPQAVAFGDVYTFSVCFPSVSYRVNPYSVSEDLGKEQFKWHSDF